MEEVDEKVLKRRQYARDYYKNNKERINELHRKYYKENPTKLKEVVKKRKTTKVAHPVEVRQNLSFEISFD